MTRQPAADQEPQHGPLEPPVVGHHVEARRRLLVPVARPRSRRLRRARATRSGSGVEIRVARSCPSIPGRLRARSTSAAALPSVATTPICAPGGAEVAGEAAGVDAGDADHAVRLQVGVERDLRPEAGGLGGVVPDHEGGGVRPGRLLVGAVDAVVPLLRVGHADDLPDVGRVREDLLVPGHRGVEDHLARGLAGRAERLALEGGPVRQRQDGPLHRSALPSPWTNRPPTMVCVQRPVSRLPFQGEFLLRERSPSAVHRPAAPPGR